MTATSTWLTISKKNRRRRVGEYVVVATVSGPLTDSQICSFLEANGIPTQVRAALKPYTIDFSLLKFSCRRTASSSPGVACKVDRGELEIEEA
jgi:hypothetical protein